MINFYIYVCIFVCNDMRKEKGTERYTLDW